MIPYPAPLICTNERRNFDRIALHGTEHGTWQWVRRYAGGKCDLYSGQEYESPLAAAKVAAKVAHYDGLPLDLTGHPYLGRHLIATWEREGRKAFLNGSDQAVCWNRYMLAGYTTAALQSMPADEETLMLQDLAVMRSAIEPYTVDTDI